MFLTLRILYTRHQRSVVASHVGEGVLPSCCHVFYKTTFVLRAQALPDFDFKFSIMY